MCELSYACLSVSFFDQITFGAMTRAMFVGVILLDFEYLVSSLKKAIRY